MSRKIAPFLPLALAALVGCGGSASPAETLEQARMERGSGDYTAALAKFQEVVAAPDATASEKFQAMRDSVECQGHVGTEADAVEAVERLIKAYPDRLDLDTLIGIGNKLGTAGKPDATLTVIEYADEKFAADPAAKEKIKLLAAAVKDMGSDVSASLEALGYLGD